ncbi:MAG: hypothetical protein LBD07_04260 [Spirochaetaceae bacterium]|jgi:hypothetical protein|nr:hypothetical protein [Spirochaetaceae bacterium]
MNKKHSVFSGNKGPRTMRGAALLIGSVTLLICGAVAVLLTCSDAIIPYAMIGDAGSYDLTSPYELVDTSTSTSPIITVHDVNTGGISIKTVRERSDGSVEILLGGSNVVSGIPAALHNVVPSPTTTYNREQTDYPISPGFADGTSIVGVADDMASFDHTLEDFISLASVSRNAKYTVVTITGMIEHGKFIEIQEQNESLRLFSNYYVSGYNAATAVFNENRHPMYRDRVYYFDPNYFSAGGYNPPAGRFRPRGNKEQGGGFDVLIWDGANPKRATFSVSYDNGRTYKKTIVDWSAVRFAEVPLYGVVWETLDEDGLVVNNRDGDPFANLNIEVNGPAPNYTATINLNLYPDGADTPPPLSVAVGAYPIFTPMNATAKRFYLETGGIKYSSSVDINGIRVELSDRIRVSAIKGASSGGPVDVIVYIDTVDPATGNPGVPVKLTLTISS